MDIFDMWIQNLPKERQFSPHSIPKDQQKEYDKWKKMAGFQETEDYDLPGAYLSGMTPVGGHLGSFGKDGRLLKAPTHETVWKTAFVELMHDVTGEYIEDVPEDRDIARRIIERIILGSQGSGN